MPKFSADTYQAEQLQRLLHERGATHLRVRKRGALLTIVSGAEDDPWPHARLRRDAVHIWRLEMAVRGGRWETTPFRSTMDQLVDMLVDQFPWTIEPIEPYSVETTDPGY